MYNNMLSKNSLVYFGAKKLEITSFNDSNFLLISLNLPKMAFLDFMPFLKFGCLMPKDTVLNNIYSRHDIPPY